MADIDSHLVEADPNSGQLRVFKDVFAGTCGGIAQVLSGQPFDTTKVRLQSAPSGTYSGAIDVVKKLLKNEGFSGFYKGTLTPLVGVGACVSIQFGVNEFMKRHYNAQNIARGLPAGTPLTNSQFYLSGVAAGVANGFLAGPIEHIRIRLQTQTTVKLFDGPIDTIKKLHSAGGVRGIFRALVPTQLREGHGMGAYFLAFEALVDNDVRRNNIQRKDIPSWRLCTYGACAGYAMWLNVYPLDIIKSKLQTDALDPKKQQYKGMLDCAAKIYQQNGIKGFFRGFVPTLVRAAPVNACTFFVFEHTIRFLDEKFPS